MNKKKLSMMLATMGLVGVVAVGGTLAYLTAQTAEVKNTFTVGEGFVEPPVDPEDPIFNGALALYESKIDVNPTTGVITKNVSEKSLGNNYPDIMPGHTLPKDPTVALTNGSADAYVFVEVTGLNSMADDDYTINGDIAASDYNGNWVKIEAYAARSAGGATLDGVYAVKKNTDDCVVKKNTSETADEHRDLATLFTELVVPTPEAGEVRTNPGDVKLNSVAVAAKGFEDVNAAYRLAVDGKLSGDGAAVE